jgi:uncharacterized membrane protein YjjB (DUF3815 family)
MSVMSILVNGLWAGLFAATLGILFTAPPGCLAATFACGLAGRLARDLCMMGGLSQNWSTIIASALIVMVAEVLIRRKTVSPIALVGAVIPLGAAMPMFVGIMQLIRVSTLTGEPLNEATVALSSNLAKVFTTCLAIALGLTVGKALVSLVRRMSSVSESA